MFSFEGFDPFGLALARLGHRRSKPVQDAFKREFFHFVIVTSQQERLCLISLNWCPVVGFLYFYLLLSFVRLFVRSFPRQALKQNALEIRVKTNQQTKQKRTKTRKKMAPFLFSSFFSLIYLHKFAGFVTGDYFMILLYLYFSNSW